jgi:hypothetical protein
MRDSFHLSKWWDNTLSAHGAIKGNRNIGQSIWTPESVAPTVTTTTISAIADITATSGGNVISDGGASVTARGVCWSTSANPTIANSHTTDGTGTGVFVSSLTGLLRETTYHVRAYATNSVGTSYGNDLSFLTYGWWVAGGVSNANCIGAYKAKGAGTLIVSRVNLANPGTHDLIDGVAPNFDNTLGWGFTGTQYLRTGIIPENDKTWSVVVKFSGITSHTGGSLIGACNNNPYPQFGIFAQYGGSDIIRFSNGGFYDDTGKGILSGTLAVAGTHCYIGGDIGATLGDVAGTFNRELYIGARNYQDAADNKMGSGNIEYEAVYDTVISLAQYNAIITAAG